MRLGNQQEIIRNGAAPGFHEIFRLFLQSARKFTDRSRSGAGRDKSGEGVGQAHVREQRSLTNHCAAQKQLFSFAMGKRKGKPESKEGKLVGRERDGRSIADLFEHLHADPALEALFQPKVSSAALYACVNDRLPI